MINNNNKKHPNIDKNALSLDIKGNRILGFNNSHTLSYLVLKTMETQIHLKIYSWFSHM